MTEKELKKLTRYQLLELIIIQAEQIEELKKKLEDSESQLKEQQIKVSEAGSIAEAALQLSGIFEAAQKAADLYLKTIKEQAETSGSIDETGNTEGQTD